MAPRCTSTSARLLALLLGATVLPCAYPKWWWSSKSSSSSGNTYTGVAGGLAKPHIAFSAPPIGSVGPVQGDVFGLKQGAYQVALYALSSDETWWGLRATEPLAVGPGATTPDHYATPFLISDWVSAAGVLMCGKEMVTLCLVDDNECRPATFSSP